MVVSIIEVNQSYPTIKTLNKGNSPKMHSNNTFLDLQKEDNLSIVDKMAGPNVSFIRNSTVIIV